MMECMGMWRLVTSVVFAFLLVSLKPVCGQDRTRQIGQSGTDLVVSVVDQIRQSGIFPNDFDLLPRIAYAASRNGMDPDTYRAGFNGGIWQITNVQFAETQNVASIPLITSKLNAIQQFYGITWQTLTWEDLRRPLHSGLAAMLHACIVEDGLDNTAIPQSVADQANYWKQFFDTIPANTEQTFIRAVASLPNLTPDPNCPPNQRASSSSIQEYATLSWTPPPNVIAERSSFRGETGIDMAPGTSYMFENVYTDGQGNERSCFFTGSVSAPNNGGPAVTYCPSNIYLMAPPGANYMTVSWATPRAAMPIVRRNRHPDETSIFPIGHNLVEYFFEERNVNDVNGALTEVSVCSFIVGILQSDATNPIALSCPTDITSASNPVNYAAATPSGGTPPYSISYVPSGNNFSPGTTTVTATVADNNAQTATCTFDVSLPAIGTDTTNPTITCPQNEFVYTATSGQSATVTYQPATADDNSGTATITYAPQSSGDVFTSGVTTITATATDPSGNTAMCMFFVIVGQDVNNPTITCPANQRETVAISGQSVVVNYPAATATDNSGSPTITYSPPQTSPGSTFTFGERTVTATATDLAGNTDTCTFTVSVELAIGTDTTNPTITCPPNEFVYTALSGQSATVTYQPATADDNSGTATITYAPQSSGDVFTSGVTTITATATDPSGNTAMCMFFVIVGQDVNNPTITCPTNQRETVAISGQSAVVNYPAATATDNSGSPTITYSPPQTSPGSTFSFGETTVTATVTDLAGNTDTCTFTVSVELAIGTDTTNPTITCPPNEFVYTATSGQSATVTYQPATADDNSGTATITYAPQSSGAVFTSGVATITATATDPSGNTAMCMFFVVVAQDAANPTITCPANQLEIVTISGQSAVVNYPAATATDNSGSPTITYSPPQTSPGSTFTFGARTVTATATDLAGNTDTCTFTVSVELGAQLDGDLIGDGSCGVRTMPGVQSRIVGGTDAALGDWPWIGSLQSTDMGSHSCGATLIRLDVAISAAHCFVFSQQQLNDGATAPTRVVFGEQRLGTTEPSEQSRTFAQIMPHPSYNPLADNAEFDLVLLFLNNPVTITDFVRPNCLAFNSNEAGTYSNCMVAGWGDLMMGNNMASDMLQQVSLPLITPESCALAPYFETSVTSNIICAGGGGTTDSCQGDSGGPMVCQSNQDSAFHLVGVVSVGSGCAVLNSPGFYTRISQFRTWIENTITQITVG